MDGEACQAGSSRGQGVATDGAMGDQHWALRASSRSTAVTSSAPESRPGGGSTEGLSNFFMVEPGPGPEQEA